MSIPLKALLAIAEILRALVAAKEVVAPIVDAIETRENVRPMKISDPRKI